MSVFTLTSCTFVEDVVIDDEGAINYVQRIDMPQMAALMNSADIDEKIEMNQISNTEYNYLEFIDLLISKGGEKTANKLKDYSMYKEDLKALNFIKFRLDLRDNFAIEIINRAKSVDEFNANSQISEDVFTSIIAKEEERKLQEKLAQPVGKKAKKKKKKEVEEENNLFGDNPFSNFSSMKYAYDGKSFSKSIDEEKFLKDYDTTDLETEEEKNIYFGMLKQIKFKYKYTFPKRIKSLSIEDAMFTQDGKSFTKEYSLEDLINKPSVGDFTVVLED